MSSRKNDIKLSGKCIKAIRSINTASDEIEDLSGKLNAIYIYFKKVVKWNEIPLDKDGNEKLSVPYSLNDKSRKQLTEIGKEMPRIEFIFNKLRFYIDFLILSTINGAEFEMMGSIIYGVQRPLCFNNCLTETTKQESTKHLAIWNRCDGLEDKPLLQFAVSQNGKITAYDKLAEVYWE